MSKINEISISIQLNGKVLNQEEIRLLVNQDEVIRLKARENAIEVKGTRFSYTEHEVMLDKSRCEIPPRAIFVASIFFERYNAGITEPVPTPELVKRVEQRYAGASPNEITTSIGEINKSVQAKLNSILKVRVIKSAGYGKGYYFDPNID